MPPISLAKQDSIVISLSAGLVWLVIERTETCDRFFEWVRDNPETEMDSVILAFILAAFGIAIFAWRRYREMLLASSAREQAEQKVWMIAYHDPLTGLPNRTALRDNLKRLTTEPSQREVALVYLDLDRFK